MIELLADYRYVGFILGTGLLLGGGLFLQRKHSLTGAIHILLAFALLLTTVTAEGYQPQDRNWKAEVQETASH